MFKKILEWLKRLFGRDSQSKIPAWDKCTLASCWNGANASQRMMNMLSPHMSDDKFTGYMNWMKGRGCNTAHLILANKADGENAGYCIYGNTWTWVINTGFCNLMKARIKKLRDNKFGIVIWLFTDDSGAYVSEAKKNFPKYLSDCKAQGLLDSASTVVVGLELDEYYNGNDVASLVNATRTVYKGKIGTHQTSGKFNYAVLGDICFYQVSPGKTAAWLKNEAKRVKSATGKPLNFFEIERSPNRPK